MSDVVLAGDVGGTKTLLALYRIDEEGPVLLTKRRYESRQHQGLSELVGGFLKDDASSTPQAVCVGVAGPVLDDRVETTNLPWVVSRAALAEAVGHDRVALINDLEATGYGLPALSPDQLVTINEGKEDSNAHAALIAAGTGLGEAVLVRQPDGSLTPAPSEGSHCDFAPRDEQEVELLRYLWQRGWTHVSYDRVVSGSGLVLIYSFLRDGGCFGEEPAWLTEALANADPAAIVSKAALDAKDAACERALQLFVGLYGAEAGNLALKVMALGGVFVGGGIAPKIRSAIEAKGFFEAFCAKGRFESLMRRMPIRLILEPHTALLGAAQHAAALS